MPETFPELNRSTLRDRRLISGRAIHATLRFAIGPNSSPGLRPGDRWCLCVSRWAEALEAGVAPPVLLSATHASTLEFVDLADLLARALDPPESPAP